MTITHESAFESNIEAHLLGDGWRRLEPAAYDRKAGVFSDEVIAFVQAPQPKAWQQLVNRHGGEATAREKFLKVGRDRARSPRDDQCAAVAGEGLGRECAAVATSSPLAA